MGESLLTVGALVWFLTAVNAQVLLQVVFVLEGLGTFVTLEFAGIRSSSCGLGNVTLCR